MRTPFCPNCRRRIEVPRMLLSGKMQLGPEAKVNLECGYCPKGRKGKVVLRAGDMPQTATVGA